MRDRQTMSRRVRGYVTSGKTTMGAAGGFSTTASVNSRERKALATMGRKGGKKAAERWSTDPDGDYARSQLKKLNKTTKRKVIRGQTTRARIQAFIGQQYVETGVTPTRKEIAAEVGCTPRTVTTHLAALREAGLLPDS